MSAYLTLIVALLGLLLFMFAAHPKAQRVGEILLFCGVLAFCIHLGNSVHRLF
jgi:Na+/phosphate symporter